LNASFTPFFPISSDVSAMGPMLDPVMGMSINDYLRLCEKFGDLAEYIRRFFELSCFDVTRIDVKLLSIYVPSGCQLTFRVWLGLQPAFDAVDLDAGLPGYLWEELEETEEPSGKGRIPFE
jgi:hypothetical protein